MKKKTFAAVIAFHALQGWITPIPSNMAVSEVLKEMQEMGGVKLSDSAESIAKKAQQIKGSKITYIAVNRHTDGDIFITMLCDIPEQRLTTEKEMFEHDGYAFSYTYNKSHPRCSEYGDVIVEKQPDGHIKRVG